MELDGISVLFCSNPGIFQKLYKIYIFYWFKLQVFVANCSDVGVIIYLVNSTSKLNLIISSYM